MLPQELLTTTLQGEASMSLFRTSPKGGSLLTRGGQVSEPGRPRPEPQVENKGKIRGAQVTHMGLSMGTEPYPAAKWLDS